MLLIIATYTSEYSMNSGFKPHFFLRYQSIRSGDYWYVGRDRWDAIAFIPNKTIKVVGLGLYELHPNGGNFTFGWKYYLENPDGAEISSS
jgi:hypothetical protein